MLRTVQEFSRSAQKKKIFPGVFQGLGLGNLTFQEFFKTLEQWETLVKCTRLPSIECQNSQWILKDDLARAIFFSYDTGSTECVYWSKGVVYSVLNWHFRFICRCESHKCMHNACMIVGRYRNVQRMLVINIWMVAMSCCSPHQRIVTIVWNWPNLYRALPIRT